MDDTRKKFIFATAKNFLKPLESNQTQTQENEEPDLDKFLNVDHCVTLYATLDNARNVILQNTINAENEYQNGVVSFIKTKSVGINDTNLLDVIQVNFFRGKPILGLYHTLENVFTPMLLQNKYTAIEPQVQNQILQLQNVLRTSVISSSDKNENTDESKIGLEVILSLDYEVEYWENMAKVGKRSRDRDMGHAFKELIEPLAMEFRKMDSLQIFDVEELLENTHNVLDDLWRHEIYTYPQPRMQHLMVLVGNSLVKYIENQFSEINIWEPVGNNHQTNLFDEILGLITRWCEICSRLTKLFWPNQALHQWIGDPFNPTVLLKFQDRLTQISQIKTVHRQLVKLLSKNEQDEMNSMDFFKPFKNLYPLQCNAYVDPQWNAAVLKFENLLRPAEERVASKLKQQLGSIHANTRQLLHEFSRYSALIARPILKQALLSELEQLLSSLMDYLQQLQIALLNIGNESKSINDTPQIIQDITSLRHLEARGKEVERISSTILTDLREYEKLSTTVNTFIQNVHQQHTDLFDSWIRQTTKSIENKTLTLKEDEPVVEFSKAKLMKVNYSPKLVVLTREVRQLSAHGYRIPANIQAVADRAKKFMSYAKILEQIAYFHNTVGDRMIISQRPMMLASAVNLAKLVQEESAVTWSEAENVETYINTLRTAVDRLSRENNQLAAYHRQMDEKVAELIEIDLIRYQHRWKDIVNQMREIITQVSNQGYTNMQTWKQHWNQELAKALEHQYQLGLEQIHNHLPEIKADLILRSGKVQFNPPVEELRMKYYSQLRRYLSIPYYFRGVSDDIPKGLFTDIADRNTSKFTRSYEKSEEFIDELHNLSKKWTPWLSLGGVDLDELADKHLKTWNDWDINFRESKSFGQQIAKLTSWEESVGSFRISLGLARSDMEAHNRRYWSTLVTSLQASIARDIGIMDRFLMSATTSLTKQPRSPDDIAEVHSAHSEILAQFPQMSELYTDLVHRNKILANWSKERVDAIVKLQGPWDNLRSLLSNHQQLIEKQLEGIRSSLSGSGKTLNDEVERWAIRWEEIKPKPHVQDLTELSKGLKILKDQRTVWEGLVQQKDKLEQDCERFRVNKPDFEQFLRIEKELEKQEKDWSIVETFTTNLQVFNDEEWIVFRKQLYKFTEFLNTSEDDLLKQTANPLSTTILKEIQKYKQAIPSLKLLRGEDFTEKHWTEIFCLLKIQVRPIDAVTFGHFLNVADELNDIQIISTLQNLNKKAASEIIVRQALAELESWEVQARFTLTPHTDSQSKEVMLIKEFKEIADTIGDNQCLLQSVKSSTDYVSFSERGGLWETRLADLDQFLGMLGQIQHKWVYLEPIFGRGTLRQEQARFQRIDREFRMILNSISKDPRVAALLRIQDLKSILTMLQDQLNRCQASLNNFLTEKRSKFPRFLFLADDDLLEILGQSTHENVIQAHLKKIFAGIHSVEIKDAGIENKRIVAMKSLHGEVVALKNHINITKPVEDWLQELVNEMQSTLRHLLQECLEDSSLKTQSGADPLKYPSQILCLAGNINFTKRVEKAITTNTLQNFLSGLKSQSDNYSNLEFDHTNVTESKVLQLKLKSLLMDLTHQIAIVEELIENNTNNLQNWCWFKQLRFYDEEGPVIRMANAQFEYSFEYLGNLAKLVHTPLTDKCFLTLTQGMFIGLGGNPYGPAGTGKTESVKALGGLLGRQVLVFNCDEGIDAKSMERILIGLARCGAWGCFDEFNRLDEGTLSSVSTQIQNIQTAIVNKCTTINVKETEVSINPFCGIFVTLNPAGAGYGARNKLPNNLKQLFRPVVMTVPDQSHIARVLLFVDGFQNSESIAKKLCELFDLARDLLSRQQHYDWGLRALKTVLHTCGNVLQNARKNNEKFSMVEEMALMVEAIQLNVLSKLTSADRLKFEAIVSNIFPVDKKSGGMHAQLIEQLKRSFEELNLQFNEQQVTKCVELYEQLKQRMGVVIVGPPSSGKSVIRKALIHALIAMKQSVKEHVVNPKAMNRNQLLGKVDLETRQWTDGVLTSYALQAINEPLDVWSWMVCDGDIDPEWIEALNSVLDDNRLLTLPSGWRIQFQPNVNFIFETHDLVHASPATISRMGIISLSEDNVNYKDVIHTWIKTISEDIRLNVERFMDDYFYKAIDWIKRQGSYLISCSQLNLIQNGLSQIRDSSSKSRFVIGVIKGLGGVLAEETKMEFIKMILSLAEEFVNQPSLYLRYDDRKDCIESYITDTNCSFNDGLPLILTDQVQDALDVLNVWLNQNQHLLLVGPHGSAKSLILQQVVNQNNDMELVTIDCNPQLKPEYVVQKISQSCITVSSNRGGRTFRPRKGRLVIQLKGFHRLRSDAWGSNMLISFLQQLITYNGVFDKNLEWIGIENTVIVGTMDKTDSISNRFTSIVRIYNISLPDTENLKIIYHLFLTEIIKKQANRVELLATMMVDFYNEIRQNFTEIQYLHYTFSPHDLTNWCNNLLRYRMDDDETLLETVCYEAKRIFGDKLVVTSKFNEILRQYLGRVWTNDLSIVKKVDSMYFIAEDDFESNLVKYNSKDWRTFIEKVVTQYESENNQVIQLPVIPELLELTSKINKIVTSAGGSVILAGRTGVGRKTATKIVGCMRNAKVMFAAGNSQQFKIDLKLVMQSAGIDGQSVLLILEDHVLKQQFIQNTINNLIATGEAIDLYANTELETIVSSLKDQLEQDGFEGSIINYFYKRVKKNLHIIVTFDITNNELKKFYEQFPQLVSNCSTIWLDSWSEQTMQDIPHLLLNLKPIENVDYNIVEIPDGFDKIHQNSPPSIQTPGRLVTFVNTYIKLYSDKHRKINHKQTKLNLGVSKLIEAGNVVSKLKLEAQEREKELADRQAKANEALEKITLTMKNAHSHKGELQELKEQTENKNRVILQRKKAIEEELVDVEPLIQEARAAVGNIRPEALSEIRSLRAPPDVIRDILEGVLRLMGILDTSWNSMKTFLAKRGVKEEIRSFDASFINPDHRLAVEKLMIQKKDSFEPKNAKRASVAAAPLATWVNANVKYSKVLEKIRPLEKEQMKLQNNLKEAEKQISNLSSGLEDVDATVAKLKQQLSIYSREAAETQVRLQAAQETLAAAQGLVSKLDEEFKRWQEQLSEMSKELKLLPNKTLLAAAIITYLPNTPDGDRKSYLHNWQELLNFAQDFKLETYASTEKEQLQWQSENLPMDKLSVQNAIIILESWLTCLLVDPSSIGISWIKNHFRNHSIEVTNQNNPRFQSILELSLRFGKTLIIEEVDEINPVLYPILRKNLFQQGARKLVQINGKSIDYHNDFKLFFASRNPILQLPPGIGSFIATINFTTTLSGLASQLIVSTIQQERPELEDRRRELAQKQEVLQIKLDELQDQLLEDLSNSQGNILENKDLLASLNETKISSAEVTKSLKESGILHAQLEKECDVYKPLADFGANLYFAVVEINKINVLYQLSVSSYKKLFLKILSTLQVEDMNHTSKTRSLMKLVYQYVARGLFKDDRLLFALHLAHKLIPNEIPDDEWELFTRQEVAMSKLNTSSANDSVPKWLPENRIQEVFLLQVALPNWYSTLKLENETAWQNFMQNGVFPPELKLTVFQQLLIIQALQPDRLYSSVAKCAGKLIGVRNLNQHLINLSQLYQETTALEPILLISSGVDPSLELRELAYKMNPGKLVEIAMSDGERETALKILSDAAGQGQWLCLKNLHLVIEWLPALCQKLKELVSPSENFRLWLITEPHNKFSPVLLQSSLNVTYEAPQGIKQGLLRIYDRWINEPKMLNRDKTRQPVENRVLFALACIHAIVQERRTFIPQGWSTFYEFSNGDLAAAQRLILYFLQKSGLNIEWAVIRGLSMEAVYGGRIDNQHDERILFTYMEQYFNENILSHLWKPLNLPNIPTGSLQEYVNVIGKLSDSDLPSYFGLPENIHRIWELHTGTTIISQLKMLELSNLKTVDFNLPLWQSKLAPVMSLWKKFNQSHDWLRTKPLETNGSQLQNFVADEFNFAINLIQYIHRWLVGLSKVIRGVVLPVNELLNIGLSLVNGKIPDLWQKRWEGPIETFAYFHAVIHRAENIIKLQKIDLFKVPIDLAILFHPETFLATIKQYTASQKNITAESLRLACYWSSSKSEFGVTIEKLQIEGAIFENGSLQLCRMDSPNVSIAPKCQIEWVTEKQYFTSGESLAVPLYYTGTRQRQLSSLHIPISESSSIWLQAGVAFYLQ